jgi:hypothetical protein
MTALRFQLSISVEVQIFLKVMQPNYERGKCFSRFKEPGQQDMNICHDFPWDVSRGQWGTVSSDLTLPGINCSNQQFLLSRDIDVWGAR